MREMVDWTLHISWIRIGRYWQPIFRSTSLIIKLVLHGFLIAIFLSLDIPTLNIEQSTTSSSMSSSETSSFFPSELLTHIEEFSCELGSMSLYIGRCDLSPWSVSKSIFSWFSLYCLVDRSRRSSSWVERGESVSISVLSSSGGFLMTTYYISKKAIKILLVGKRGESVSISILGPWKAWPRSWMYGIEILLVVSLRGRGGSKDGWKEWRSPECAAILWTNQTGEAFEERVVIARGTLVEAEIKNRLA